MELNCKRVEVLDRATGAKVETVSTVLAAARVAKSTGRDSRDVELQLRGGQQQSTAGFVYEPLAE